MPPKDALGPKRIAAIAGLAAVTLLVGLGASRLSYHEAIWAQSARETIAAADPVVPLLDGRPWLEKPPLGTWLIAASARVSGGVTEAAARFPSAIAAMILCVGVGSIAARRFGRDVGLFAGWIQATTLWTGARGRLAEADILQAALIVGAMGALDRIRDRSARARWAFFVLLGLTSLLKGIGFGAALILASTLGLLFWDRDRKSLRALIAPAAVGVSLLLALAWPLLVLARHPEALGLWALHVTDRLATRPSQFAGETWGEYLASFFWQTLPWTPLALLGAWGSARRAARDRFGPDRLLWSWAVLPAALVSLASVKNAHYLIHSLPPWSIWAALGLETVRGRRAVAPDRFLRRVSLACLALGVLFASAFSLLAPRLDRRAPEWAFYERAGRLLRPGEPLLLLYDDWDRLPYPSPFGPMPHDLAVRLYYLDRPASWRVAGEDLLSRPPAPPFSAIARERDLPILKQLGPVEVIARGPTSRWDRAFVLVRVEEMPRRVARVLTPSLPLTPFLPRRILGQNRIFTVRLLTSCR